MLVSVIIPVFNSAATIGRAIDSALAQRFDGGYEIIAVNDGSTDSSVEALEAYGSCIRVLRQENRGPAAARNAGCRVARGRYFAFLDADDTWTSNKLAATVSVLERDGRAVLVFSDALPVDAAGDQIAESYVKDLGFAPTMRDLLTRWWPILPSTAVLRREAFVVCGGFVEEFRGAGYEDPLLWLVMREQGEFRYVAERLAHYREIGVADRMEKYMLAQNIFLRRVRERYGAAARELIRGTRRAYATALSHEGLLALRAGDRAMARRYFARAWLGRPAGVNNGLRLMRTFLPLRLAQSLSGATGRGKSAKREV